MALTSRARRSNCSGQTSLRVVFCGSSEVTSERIRDKIAASKRRDCAGSGLPLVVTQNTLKVTDAAPPLSAAGATGLAGATTPTG